MTKTSFFAIACVVLSCSLYSLAADRTSFASLPPEAQASIKAALEKNVAVRHFTLASSDGANGDVFGSSVAIDGNTVVVGAPCHANLTGEAYVFVRPNGGWGSMTQTARLTASDGTIGDGFGVSVSISGNTIIVGASGASVGG